MQKDFIRQLYEMVFHYGLEGGFPVQEEPVIIDHTEVLPEVCVTGSILDRSRSGRLIVTARLSVIRDIGQRTASFVAIIEGHCSGTWMMVPLPLLLVAVVLFFSKHRKTQQRQAIFCSETALQQADMLLVTNVEPEKFAVAMGNETK